MVSIRSYIMIINWHCFNRWHQIPRFRRAKVERSEIACCGDVYLIMKVNKKKVIENIAASMIMVLAVVLVVVFLYDWGIDDIAIPIKDIYAPGDGRLTIAIFKMILSGGLNVISPPTTSLLNFPFQFQLYDFPLPFASNFMYIKFLSVFTDDAVVAFNLYYLSTFIMNALGMFFVLRVLRINIYIAVACSLIFTFLPFHFWRLPHTFYSGYFFIPFWIYVSISLFRRKALFFLRDDRGDVRVDYSFRNLFRKEEY